MATDDAPARPPTSSAPIEVGTFVTQNATWYVEPPDEVVASIVRMANPDTAIPSARLLSSLVMLKILAPRESAGLRIYQHNEAVKILDRIQAKLVQLHYAAQLQRERR
jgi:hypothetical protein